MTFDHKIRDGKLQHNIKKEAAKYEQYLEVELINMNILQLTK